MSQSLDGLTGVLSSEVADEADVLLHPLEGPQLHGVVDDLHRILQNLEAKCDSFQSKYGLNTKHGGGSIMMRDSFLETQPNGKCALIIENPTVIYVFMFIISQ